jgi:hypothetical protein
VILSYVEITMVFILPFQIEQCRQEEEQLVLLAEEE